MDMDVVKIIAAIFLPPLGVFLQVGFGKDFWINLLLTEKTGHKPRPSRTALC